MLSIYRQWLGSLFLPDPDYTRQRVGDVVRQYGPHHGPLGNCVTYLGPPDDMAAFRRAMIAELAFFGALSYGFEWKVVRGLVPDGAEDLLAAEGLEAGELEVAMAYALDVPMDSVKPPFPIRPLETQADLAQIAGQQAAIWGGDFTWLINNLWHEKNNAPETISLWGAFDGEKLIGTGWMRFNSLDDGDGGKVLVPCLQGGATLAEYRGRGVFRSLVAHRLNAAKQRGCSHVLVEAGPNSRPILQRLGFTAVAETVPYLRQPPKVD